MKFWSRSHRLNVVERLPANAHVPSADLSSINEVKTEEVLC
ncbi:MAG: hypothetical protein AB8E15_06380 [Bdellovibrionales bacterium]